MTTLAILSDIGIPDILDILLISVVSYYLYLWFWGTKAFKALVGVILMSGIFVLAKYWGLFLTTWMFQVLWQVFVILMIILFQKEIRQVLEHFNPLQPLGFDKPTETDDWIAEFVRWAWEAAQKRLGAIVIFRQKDAVFDLITPGVDFTADPQGVILESIFQKNSPLHDGALLIANRKIKKAACYLPLSTREDLPLIYGTRHRAALGLSEQCDARVLVISEERGEIAFAVKGNIRKIRDQEGLEKQIRDTLGPDKKNDHGLNRRIASIFIHKWKVKAIVCAMVFVAWLVFAGQQDIIKTMEIPVKLQNIPQALKMQEQAHQNVVITCRGLRKDISLLDDSLIYAAIDLSFAAPGIALKSVTPANIVLPNDRIDVTDISPGTIGLVLAPR